MVKFSVVTVSVSRSIVTLMSCAIVTPGRIGSMC
jgi:hypothetical protein